jgi:hypothetical protein
MPAPDDHWPQPGRDDVIRIATRLARHAAATIFVPVVFLGLVASPLSTTLVGGPVAATLAVTCGLTAYRLFAERWPQVHFLRTCGSIGFGLPLYLEGADVLGTLGGALTLALVAIGTCLVVARIGSGQNPFDLPPPSATSTRPPPVTANDDDLRRLLAAMPLEALFEEWRATDEGDYLLPQPGRQARNQLRLLLLDELRHRDPTGVDRWLARGAVDPPEHHITDDPPPPR